MLRRKLFASASLLLAAVVLVLGASPVFATAAKTGGGDGLRISPVRSDLTINAGASQTVDVYVTNLTSAPADLRGVVDDFTAGNDETGTPYILLNGEKAPTHSLKGFVSSIGSFTLGSQATKDVKVTITIPRGAKAGGYFGAVRILPASANGTKNVNLTASVGSLILVTVPGPVTQQMGIASFDVRRMNTKTNELNGSSFIFTSKKNLDGVARFDNTGDLQEEPFGKIILKKGSKVLGSYEINNTTPRGNVLPDSIRRFWVPLQGLGSFGKYTLEGNFGYGNKGQLLTAKTTFYIIPLAVIVLVIVIIALILFFVFVLPRLVRAYNRRVIKKATGRRR
ncbi:MAG TPA: hypothetical protein VGG13_02100 [Candidatus Saccharimonadales bacterium]|jgi:hypothetical protein